jgi:hypothetical protein
MTVIDETATTSIGSNSLAEIAELIRAEHEAVGAALKRCIVHVITAGELLIEAKAHLRHGEWEPWLAENCAIPARSARHYMRLAKHKDKLADENGNVAVLGVTEAVGLLTAIGPVQDAASQYAHFLLELEAIDPRIELTPVGMKLPDDISKEKWLAVGQLMTACYGPLIQALETDGNTRPGNYPQSLGTAPPDGLQVTRQPDLSPVEI